MKIIIDFDGTLTAEETQVKALASLSLDTLAHEIERLARDPGLRQQLATAGLEYARGRTWASCAQQFARVFSFLF